jgi:hypothetical protein
MEVAATAGRQQGPVKEETVKRGGCGRMERGGGGGGDGPGGWIEEMALWVEKEGDAMKVKKVALLSYSGCGGLSFFLNLQEKNYSKPLPLFLHQHPPPLFQS